MEANLRLERRGATAAHDPSIPSAPTGDPVGPATTWVESLRAAQVPVTPPHNSPISFFLPDLNFSETFHPQAAMAPKKASASQTSEAPVEAGELGAALLESRITTAGVDKVRYLAEPTKTAGNDQIDEF